MQPLSNTRPLWIEVNLDALAHNIAEVRRVVGDDVLITAVVKANAYGHGSVQAAPVFLANGADRLAVATIEEAIEIRKAGITAPILILGATERPRARALVKWQLDQTIFTRASAEALSEAAQDLGSPARIHIAVDTGMGRIGFLPTEESLDEIEEILQLPGLEFEGLFSHFSTADEADKTYSREQIRRYKFFQEGLAARGLVPHVAHMANSAAISDLPEIHMDMVRAGIILYGLYPSHEVDETKLDLQPTLALKCRITNLKTLQDGEYIGYGRKYQTKGSRRIATCPMGYADGYTRLLSNKAEVLVHGHRAPVVGNICMDQCMIDVTDIPEDLAIGDEVVLIGRQGDEVISPEELANILGTISYEIFCMLSRRIPRTYFKDGALVENCNYLYNTTENPE
ncbi:alanine racemase [Peptococcus simiae]|uniref:Alanine racemase n=1 Tax=Peptococcus simiae TaxID=1643805 RepID=A0ABW9GWP6_9FIRM